MVRIESPRLATAYVVVSLMSLLACATHQAGRCADLDTVVQHIEGLAVRDWRSVTEDDAKRLWSGTRLKLQIISQTDRCDVIALMCGKQSEAICPSCDTLTLAELDDTKGAACDRRLESVAISRTVDTYGDAVAFANRIIYAASGDRSKLLRVTESPDQGPISISWEPRLTGAPRVLQITFTPLGMKWTVYAYLG